MRHMPVEHAGGGGLQQGSPLVQNRATYHTINTWYIRQYVYKVLMMYLARSNAGSEANWNVSYLSSCSVSFLLCLCRWLPSCLLAGNTLDNLVQRSPLVRSVYITYTLIFPSSFFPLRTPA